MVGGRALSLGVGQFFDWVFGGTSCCNTVAFNAVLRPMRPFKLNRPNLTPSTPSSLGKNALKTKGFKVQQVAAVHVGRNVKKLSNPALKRDWLTAGFRPLPASPLAPR